MYKAVLALLLCCACANAGFVSYTYHGNFEGAPVTSRVTFTTWSDNKLTIYLDNLQPDITKLHQLVSGLHFSVVSPMLLTETRGDTTMLGADGSYDLVFQGNSLYPWWYHGDSGFLNTFNQMEMIIGPDNSNRLYLDHGKFDNLPQEFTYFNPYVLGSAAFTFDNFYGDVGTEFKDVYFLYSPWSQPYTSPPVDLVLGDYPPPTPVPEPATVLLGIIGIALCLGKRYL